MPDNYHANPPLPLNQEQRRGLREIYNELYRLQIRAIAISEDYCRRAELSAALSPDSGRDDTRHRQEWLPNETATPPSNSRSTENHPRTTGCADSRGARGRMYIDNPLAPIVDALTDAGCRIARQLRTEFPQTISSPPYSPQSPCLSDDGNIRGRAGKRAGSITFRDLTSAEYDELTRGCHKASPRQFEGKAPPGRCKCKQGGTPREERLTHRETPSEFPR